MKPLKVLVYALSVIAAKAQGAEPNVRPAVLVQTDISEYNNGSWWESGLVVFESGEIGYYPLDRIEVLPGQFDNKAVIPIDVPGALDMDLKD